MHDVTVFENLFDSDFNEVIKSELILRTNWRIASDVVPDEYSDAGFSSVSYHINPDNPATLYNPNLNAWAYLVLHKITKTLGSPINARRFLWSYYNRSSEGTSHIDSDDRNCYSIVYNIDDNDGGTWIEDTFYESKQGKALLFPSWLDHRGVGPKISNL